MRRERLWLGWVAGGSAAVAAYAPRPAGGVRPADVRQAEAVMHRAGRQTVVAA